MTPTPFATLIFEPDRARGERVNIGLVFFVPDGIRVMMADNLAKVEAIAPTFRAERLRTLPLRLEEMLRELPDTAARHRALVGGLGPVRALPELGTVYADTEQELEAAGGRLLAAVAVTPSKPRSLRKGSRGSDLQRELTTFFRRKQVLGKDVTDVDHHVVTNFPIWPAAAMYAEFAVKNGVYTVTETVDIRSTMNRPKLNEGHAKALLMIKAREQLGENSRRYGIVAADSWQAARPVLESLEPFCSEVVNFHDPSDMRGYLKVIGEATGATLELADVLG